MSESIEKPKGEDIASSIASSTPATANPYLTPISIIIAGIFIAGAVFFTRTAPTTTAVTGSPVPQARPTEDPAILEKMPPITAQDRIRGNASAPVKIVEYSDIDCPFCRQLHPTLKKVYDEYGKSGKVAWVYRHFPLDQLHPNARIKAEATECVLELGGTEKFWSFLDKLYETPVDPTQLTDTAKGIGVDATKFKACLDAGKYKQLVQDQQQGGIAAGGTGTPYNIIVNSKGKKIAIPGALPYESFKQAIDEALK